MDALASADILFFGDFCLDRRGGGLSCRDDSGAYVPVAIGSRALTILDSLIARAGGVVSKDEIIAAVWPGLVVEDSIPDGPDVSIAPCTRSGPRARELHPNGTWAGLSLCCCCGSACHGGAVGSRPASGQLPASTSVSRSRCFGRACSHKAIKLPNPRSTPSGPHGRPASHVLGRAAIW